MTDYHMGDLNDWTEEEKKRAEENMAKYRKIEAVAEPLYKQIKGYVGEALQGCATKKVRDDLLRRIDQAERLSQELKTGYHEFVPDQSRIRVLGAYEFCVRFRRKKTNKR